MLPKCGIVTSVFFMLLSACTPPPVTTATPVAPADPVLAFLAQAHPGQAAVIQSATYGGPVSVTINREYNAASGDICKSYSLVRPNGTAGQQLACGDGSNWSYVPPLQAQQSVAGAQ
jgi:hypothetical protein